MVPWMDSINGLKLCIGQVPMQPCGPHNFGLSSDARMYLTETRAVSGSGPLPPARKTLAQDRLSPAISLHH